MKIGIVDVGGGNRGIYGAGVLDFLIDHQIEVDYFIGVSAGSANGVSYIGKQRGRNYQFYNNYSFRKEYMSVGMFFKRKNFLDLDYVYSTLSNSNGENPVDYESFIHNSTDLVVVATNACTGEPHYFDKKSIQKDNYDVLKASSCVPIACQAYKIDHQFYFDGGLSDPIPFKKAFEDGCDKVVIILTRPKDYFRNGKMDIRLSKLIAHKYEQSAIKLQNRSVTYNDSLKQALNLEKDGKVFIVSPDHSIQLDTFTTSHHKLEALYKMGYEHAKKIIDFIKQ